MDLRNKWAIGQPEGITVIKDWSQSKVLKSEKRYGAIICLTMHRLHSLFIHRPLLLDDKDAAYILFSLGMKLLEPVEIEFHRDHTTDNIFITIRSETSQGGKLFSIVEGMQYPIVRSEYYER